MSKLGTLIAIPIALIGLKRLQESIKDEPVTEPIIEEPVQETERFTDLWPTTLDPFQVAPSIDPLMPTGPIKQPSADIPKFVPFEILGSGGDASKLPDWGKLPTKFDFDPFGFKDR